MANSLVGDPRKAAEAAAKPELEESLKLLEEARGRALKLVDEAFEKSLREAEKKLEEMLSNAEEQLKSTVSGLELELKAEVNKVKSGFIEEAIRKALEKIRESKNEPWYEKFLEKTLLRLKSEGYKELVLYAAEDDMNRIEALIARLGLGDFKVSRKPVDIIGGIIAETPDGSVRLDYSIDLAVKMNMHRLMSVASKNLFLEA